MSSSPFLTRSQQRAQRRRSWILLLLVLGVALGSFALGVVVGRSSRPAQPALRPDQAALPVVRPLPLPPRPTGAAPAELTPPAGGVPTAAAAAAATEASTQLGSGINRPAAAVVSAPAAAVPPAREPSKEPSREPSKEGSGAAGAVSYQVLTASFPAGKEAEAFVRRLERKGYRPYMTTSEVQGKLWYRVAVGPYPDYDSAQAAAERLRREERVAPIVRKRRP